MSHLPEQECKLVHIPFEPLDYHGLLLSPVGLLVIAYGEECVRLRARREALGKVGDFISHAHARYRGIVSPTLAVHKTLLDHAVHELVACCVRGRAYQHLWSPDAQLGSGLLLVELAEDP